MPLLARAPHKRLVIRPGSAYIVIMVNIVKESAHAAIIT